MRVPVVAALVALLSGGTHSAWGSQIPDLQEYTDHAFSKSAFLRAGAGIGIAEIANSPEEWGRGPDGVAKRFGSVFGKHLIRSSVQVTVAALREEDLKYYPSQKSGFGARTRHALVSVLIARNQTGGGTTVAGGRLAGAFSSGFVSELWLPDRLHTFSNGMRSSGISLGVDAVTNVFREFWPDIRRSLRRQ
jgi:hypothetical protein